MKESAINTTAIKPAWRLRPNERRGTLFTVDLLIAVFALIVALYAWSQGDEWYKFTWEFLQVRVPVWFYFLPVVWLLMLVESYNPRRSNILADTIRELSIAAGVLTVLYLIMFFLSEPNSQPRRGVAVFIIAVFALTISWRLAFHRVFTARRFMRRVLVVGAGRSGSRLAKIIRESSPQPFFMVGFVDDDPDKNGQEIYGYKVIGQSSNLLRVARENQVTDLVFAITGEMNPGTFAALIDAEEQGIEVTTMPVIYEELMGRVPINLLDSDWLLRSFIDQSHIGGFYDLVKRLLDLLGGLIGTALFALTFPLFAMVILLTSGRPIFYIQERLGKNGRSYQMLKYRTMIPNAEKNGVPVPATEHDERTTRVGRLLRRMHLDEIPQFVNVLKGEMSLVGPRAERPELVQELQNEIPFYRARLFVKPGLTGWAQVNFGYAAGIEMNSIKLEYDLYYIKHRNILLDFLIVLRTVSTVVFLKGR